MNELSEFFNLLSQEKKKKKEKLHSLVGDIELGSSLICTSDTANANVFASLDWEEISR